MPNKAWPRLRSPISNEGRRAAAVKCATRSFLPHPDEHAAGAAAAVDADATNTTTTTTTTTGGDSCRHPPPPHTDSSDNSSGLGGALEGSEAFRWGEKSYPSDPISTTPAESARSGREYAAATSPGGGGGGTPGSPGKYPGR